MYMPARMPKRIIESENRRHNKRRREHARPARPAVPPPFRDVEFIVQPKDAKAYGWVYIFEIHFIEVEGLSRLLLQCQKSGGQSSGSALKTVKSAV
jgi:hypothetical protein